MCGQQTGKVVLVLGGCGFIGRHVVSALRDMGASVIVGTRDPERAERRLPPQVQGCGRRGAHLERLFRPDDWSPLLAGVDAVVNCVGILRPRGRERYQAVHAQAPAALARACAEHGLRLLHVSALGLEAPARSGFIRSKREGEAGIRAAGGQACLVRPSLLDADDSGFGARWLRRVARWPVHPLPASARGHIAALDVRDLGEAIARLLLQPEPLPAAVELGGRDALDLGDYLALLRRNYRSRPARRLSVPGWLARLVAHACDLLHLTPLSYGHWELLGRDNLPAENALPALLGRLPRRLGPEEADPRPMPQSVAPWAIPWRVRRS
ncbi:MAG TPA: NAD-dependent epimerase/dehydratase family protein [Arenimonas sp.]|nr:NAD-dependent epimerase/dehydratase family protein [Arenimonas sp.]